MTEWLLGVDVGGSGSRSSLVPLESGRPAWGASRRFDGARLTVAPGGSTGGQVALELAQTALDFHQILAEDIRGVAAGIAGLETVVANPPEYVDRLQHMFPLARVVLSTDIVTAHVGGLGEPGGVLAVGTGAVALGTDFDTLWTRVDGWGHLIGDLGAGAWIGTRALQEGAAAADGRSETGAALGALIREKLGPVTAWPAAIYGRADRAGALAELAPLVLALASDGDPAAGAIVQQAADHLATTLHAVFVEGVPRRAALVGGLVENSSLMRELITDRLEDRRSGVEIQTALGTPLDGAVKLAALAASNHLPASGPFFR